VTNLVSSMLKYIRHKSIVAQAPTFLINIGQARKTFLGKHSILFHPTLVKKKTGFTALAPERRSKRGNPSWSPWRRTHPTPGSGGSTLEGSASESVNIGKKH